MQESGQATGRRRAAAGPPLVALALIVAANVAGSFYWIDRNIVLVGRDSSGHLERTVKAAETLATFSLRSLFQAITFTDYRPPALYLLTVPFYRLFGMSMDSAQLVNIVLLAVIVALTYAVGRRLAGGAVGLFAALLVGLLPIQMGLSRLFYVENLLTSLLLVNVWALIECDGFRRRGWSLLWGGSLGAALLVKWTTPIYLLLPLGYALWRHRRELFGAGEQGRLGEPRFVRTHLNWPRLGLAVLGGAVLAALWVWPSRDLLEELALGAALPPLWALAAALAIYAASLPHVPRSNLWSALFLAAALASLWYLPRLDFLTRLSDVAFGTDRGNQESLNLLRWSNYTRYFGFLVREHLGLLPSLLILSPALWVWAGRLRRRRPLRPGFIYLWLSLLSAYICLIWLAQANPRNLAPLLPMLAILLAESLTGLPRLPAIVLGAAWALLLAFQWTMYTFDGMAPAHARAPQLWAASDYLARPASGSTDPGFWIQPDVLAAIGSPEGEPASFGVLVDSWELHRGSFRYLIALDRLNIELMTLTEPEGRGWSDMLANQWLLVKDGDNSGVRGPGRAALERVLNGDSLFHQLYSPAWRYALPSGDTATLYQRKDGPARPLDYPVVLIETAPVAEALNAWWSPSATVLFNSRDTAVWVGIHDVQANPVRIITPEGPGAAELLADVAGTLFLVTRFDRRDMVAALPPDVYFAREVVSGDTALAVYGAGIGPDTAASPQSAWTEFDLAELRTPREIVPGAVLPVELSAEGAVDPDIKLSLRLLDPAGEVVAQNDVALAAEMRAGLLLPPAAEPGRYTLAALAYRGDSLESIPNQASQELAPLAEVTVLPAH